jgi:hypothetical protein
MKSELRLPGSFALKSEKTDLFLPFDLPQAFAFRLPRTSRDFPGLLQTFRDLREWKLTVLCIA